MSGSPGDAGGPTGGEASVRMVQVVYPQHLNHHGTLFGGEALRMMDTAAFVAATRRARRAMVTVAVENVTYEAPVHHGEIVEIDATVTGVGRTSVTVEVEMHAEQPLSGDRRRCGNGRFVFVALGAEGDPTPVV
ncbi:MAG TPA: acyl-CoA thioesterase [Solirubrobacteraceae bacterium]|nr:acyl-CoA thioesterase [Solirubrobacteraceae bacterium]